MDVRIDTIESRIRVSDAEALLSPEVLRRIVEAVKQAMAEESAIQAERDGDKNINRNASMLGSWES